MKISDAMHAILERCDDMNLQNNCDFMSVESFAKYHGITVEMAYKIFSLSTDYDLLKNKGA